MVTPTVETAGDKNRTRKTREPSGVQEREEEKEGLPVDGARKEVTWLLIPDELHGILPLARLTSLLAGDGAKKAVDVMRFDDLDCSDEQLLGVLAEKVKAKEVAGITLLQEAWQPPIEEILSMIRDIRQAVGAETEIVIGLIGKPVADEVLTPANKEQLAIWAMKIRPLADPALAVISLIR